METNTITNLNNEVLNQTPKVDKYGLVKVKNPNGQFLRNVILGLCMLFLSIGGFAFGKLLPKRVSEGGEPTQIEQVDAAAGDLVYVYFYTNGGTIVSRGDFDYSTSTTTYCYDRVSNNYMLGTLPTYTRSGYTFIGWSYVQSNGTGTVVTSSTRPLYDLGDKSSYSIYAIWADRFLDVSSSSSFSIRNGCDGGSTTGKAWDKNVFVSTDGKATWTEWDGSLKTATTTNSPDGKYHIYYVGFGNVDITESAGDQYRWIFSGGGDVSIDGDIEDLRDYNKTVTMTDGAYRYMFYNWQTLVKAPALSATTLSTYCYANMFTNCYELKSVPAINTTALPNYCCYQMFKNCESIKLSSTRTNESRGDFQKPYCLPYRYNATSVGTNWSYEMFYGTSGSYSGNIYTGYTMDANNTVYLDEGNDVPGLEYRKVYVHTNDSSKAFQFDQSYSGNWKQGTNAGEYYTYCYDYSWGNDGSNSGAFVVLPKASSSANSAFRGWFVGSSVLYEAYADQPMNQANVRYAVGSSPGQVGHLDNGDFHYYAVWQTKYVTFYSSNPFTLKTHGGYKYWNGLVRYSTDGSTWYDWNGSTLTAIEADNDMYYIYLYGVGNSYMTWNSSDAPDYWQISGTDGSVYIEGDLEDLRDTAREVDLSLYSYAYAKMFQGQNAIKSLQYLTLSYKTPSSYCYCLMFDSCQYLINTPIFGNTSAGEHCCESMFANCDRIVTMPVLRATTLASDSYSNMFADSDSVYLNATRTGDYQKPYRIPISGTASGGSGAMYMLFNDAASPVNGPNLNQIYYLHKDNTVNGLNYYNIIIDGLSSSDGNKGILEDWMWDSGDQQYITYYGWDTSLGVAAPAETIVLPNPTRTGYTFGGWYYDYGTYNQPLVDNTINTASISSNSGLSVYAKWTPITYYIDYVLGSGASFGTNHPTSAQYGDYIGVDAPTRTGYTFAGWTFSGCSGTWFYQPVTGDGTGYYSDSSRTINNPATFGGMNFSNVNGAHVTFTANWTADTYTTTLSTEISSFEHWTKYFDTCFTSYSSNGNKTTFNFVGTDSGWEQAYYPVSMTAGRTYTFSYYYSAPYYSFRDSSSGMRLQLYSTTPPNAETSEKMIKCNYITANTSGTGYMDYTCSSTGTYYLSFNFGWVGDSAQQTWTLGDFVLTETVSATYNSTYGTLPTPTRIGYSFAGWSFDKSGYLPSGYQQVEYIQSDGTQWINTGITGRSGLTVKAGISWVNYVSGNDYYDMLIGSKPSSYFVPIRTHTQGYMAYYYYGDNVRASMPFAMGDGIFHDVVSVMNVSEQYMLVDGSQLLYSADTNTVDTNMNMYLFGCNSGDASAYRKSAVKLSYMQIYDGTNLIANYIPCYRTSDDAIGLYDTVSGSFLQKAGGNTFTKGVDVVQTVTSSTTVNVTRDHTLYANWIKYIEFYSDDYFEITALNSSSPTWDGHIYTSLGYPTDSSSWSEWNGNTLGAASTDGVYHLYMYGVGNTHISEGHCWSIGTSGSAGCVSLLGDTEDLRDNVAARQTPTTMAAYCYQSMFYQQTVLGNVSQFVVSKVNTIQSCNDMFLGCQYITQAPQLPATTLGNNCYWGMFYGCVRLATLPTLPATTLNAYCYNAMFRDCIALTSIPSNYLPATTMVGYCYGSMFQGCTGLTSIPSTLLPATSLDTGCYEGMFYGCTGLTTLPSGLLPATTISNSGYASMFRSCSGLVTIPSNLLSSTSLDGWCYYYMFAGCTNLTSLPTLSATTAPAACYEGMFLGCTSLTTIPSNYLPATSVDSYCYLDMFNGCTSLTTVPSNLLPATSVSAYCYKNMFKGCSSLTTVPALPATTMANECYREMFDSCSSLNVLPTLPATTLANLCYYHMFSNCTSLTSLPNLPATTLYDACYDGMFANCSSIYMSSSRGGDYQKPYRVPAQGGGIDGTDSFSNMFYGVNGDGTMPYTPSINATYYLKSTNNSNDSVNGMVYYKIILNYIYGATIGEGWHYDSYYDRYETYYYTDCAAIALPTPSARTGFTCTYWYPEGNFNASPVNTATTDGTGEKCYSINWSAKPYKVSFDYNDGERNENLFQRSDYQMLPGASTDNYGDILGFSLSNLTMGKTYTVTISPGAYWIKMSYALEGWANFTQDAKVDHGNSTMEVSSANLITSHTFTYEKYPDVLNQRYYIFFDLTGNGQIETSISAYNDVQIKIEEASSATGYTEPSRYIDYAARYDSAGSLPTLNKDGYTFQGWYKPDAVFNLSAVTWGDPRSEVLSYINSLSAGTYLMRLTAKLASKGANFNADGANAGYGFYLRNDADGSSQYYQIVDWGNAQVGNVGYIETYLTITGTAAGNYYGAYFYCGDGTHNVETVGNGDLLFEVYDFSDDRVYDSTTLNIASDHTLVAYWTVNQYLVTANANGGTISNPNANGWSGDASLTSKSVDCDAEFGTLPSVSRTGYTFGGWYQAETGYTVDTLDDDGYHKNRIYFQSGTTFGAGMTLYIDISYSGTLDHLDVNDNDLNSYSVNYLTDTGSRIYGYTVINDNYGSYSFIDLNFTTVSHPITINKLELVNWNGTAVSSSTTMGAADANLYAKWTPITYYVSYDGNGSTSGSMSNSTHTYDVAQDLTANAYSRAYTISFTYNGATGGNSDASLTATATFNGWATASDGAKVYNNGQSVTNLTSTNGATFPLYANWTLGSITLPTPTKTGYTFAGWYSDSGFNTSVGAAGASYTPGANETLYAKWNAQSYTLTANANGGTISNPNANGWSGDASSTSKSVDYNAQFGTLPSVSRTGYTFAGWYGRNLFNKNNYLLTSNFSAGTSDYANAPIQLEANTEYVVRIYRKNNFTGTGNGYLLLSDNTDINWNWTAITHADGVDSANTSWVNCVYTTGDDGKLWIGYLYLDQSNLDAIWANTDVVILKQTGGLTGGHFNSSTSSYDSSYEPYIGTDEITNSSRMTSTEGAVIYAKWTINQYTLTVNYAGYNGPSSAPDITIDGSTVSLNGNKTITLDYSTSPYDVAISSGTYLRIGFGSSPTGVVEVYTVLDGREDYGEEISKTYSDWAPTSNATLNVYITRYHIIDYNPYLRGSNNEGEYQSANITINSTSVATGVHDYYKAWPHGSTFSLTSIATSGYKVATSNSSTASDYAASKTFEGNIIANTYVEAYFSNLYSITFEGNENTSGSTASMNDLIYNVSYNLTSNGFAKTGYSFAGWNTEANGSGSSYSNGQSVSGLTTTANGSVTLYAQWTINQYNLTINPNGGSWNSTTNNTVITQNYDTTYTVSGDPTREGYTFGGWTQSGAGTWSSPTYTFGAGDGNLTANWIPNLSGSVTINGVNKYGELLTAQVTNTDNAGLTYYWYSNDSAGTSGGTLIASGDYTSISVDKTLVGKYIYVEVRATKTGYADATWKDDTSSAMGKRDITLTSATDSKVYDGTALTNNTVTIGGDGLATTDRATFNVTGSQTTVGSSENTFTLSDIKDGNGSGSSVKTTCYNVTSTTNGTLTVTKATGSLTADPNSLSLVYPESKTSTVTTTNDDGLGTLIVSTSNSSVATATVNQSTGVVTVTAGTTAGSATITVTSAETANYLESSVTISVTVTAGTLSVTITGYSGVYDGNTHSATVNTNTEGATIKYRVGDTGAYDIDVIPSIKDVGSVTYYWQATKAGYTTKTGNFTLAVTAKTLTVTADAKQKTYGDSDPALTYTYFGNVAGETPAFSGALSRVAGEDVGTYAITQGTLTLVSSATLTATNYSLSFDSANLTIGKYDLANATITGVNASYEYTGNQITPTPTVTAPGSPVKDTHYTVGYGTNTNVGENAGSVTITAVNNTNYTGSQTVYFDITRQGVKVPSPSAKTYNGSLQNHGITFDGNMMSIVVDDSTQSATNAGTYNVVFQIGANYQWNDSEENPTGTRQVSWTINPYDISANGNASIASVATADYDGNAKTPTPAVTSNHTGSASTLVAGTDFDYQHFNNTEAGTATVTATGKGNFTGTIQTTFTIRARLVYDKNANDATGTTANQYANKNSAVTLSANGFTKTNYTFGGWNTQANGQGTSYAPGDSFTLTASSTTLFAKWDLSTFTVTANPNNGTITNLNGWTASSTNATKDIAIGTAYNTLPSVYRVGYVFNGWNTQANGSGSTVTAETIMNTAAAHTIYAQWSEAVARIGSTYYTTLEGAVNSVASNGSATIYLVRSTTITSSIGVYAGKTINIVAEAENITVTFTDAKLRAGVNAYATNGVLSLGAIPNATYTDINSNTISTSVLNSFTFTRTTNNTIVDVDWSASVLNIYGGNYTHGGINQYMFSTTRQGATINAYGGNYTNGGIVFAVWNSNDVLNIHGGNFTGVTDYIAFVNGTMNMYGDITTTSRKLATIAYNTNNGMLYIQGQLSNQNPYIFSWNSYNRSISTEYLGDELIRFGNGLNASDYSSKFTLENSDYTTYVDTTANTINLSKVFTITYKDQGNVDYSGSNAGSLPTTYTYGTALNLVDGVKTGYTFAGWFDNSACTGDAIATLGATAYTANITLYAKWTEQASYLRKNWLNVVRENGVTLSDVLSIEFTTVSSTANAAKYSGFTQLCSVGSYMDNGTCGVNAWDSTKPCYDATAYWNSTTGAIIVYYPYKLYAPTDSSYLFSHENDNYVPTNLATVTLDATFDTSTATNMFKMFRTTKVASLDLSHFDTSNVTNMANMFWQCRSLASVNISSFDTSNVVYMNYMFADICAETLDVSNFNTENVNNFSGMFVGMSAIKRLDISNFYIKSEANISSMTGNTLETFVSPYELNGKTLATNQANWYVLDNGTLTGNATSSITLENTTYVRGYTITYNLNDGSWTNAYTAPQMFYYEQSAVTLPIASNIEKTGYTFAGWYANVGLTGDAITSIPTHSTGNKEYWAGWTINTYTATIRYNLGNNSHPTSLTITVENGFLTANSSDTTGNTKSMTISYNGQPIYWKHQYNTSAQTLTATKTNLDRQYYVYYNKDNQFANDGSNTVSGSWTPTDDCELRFGTIEYFTVTVHSGTGISSATFTSYWSNGKTTERFKNQTSVVSRIFYDEKVIFSAAAATGYTFAGYYDVNDTLISSNEEYTVNSVTADIELWAKATVNAYTLTFDVNAFDAVQNTVYSDENDPISINGSKVSNLNANNYIQASAVDGNETPYLSNSSWEVQVKFQKSTTANNQYLFNSRGTGSVKGILIGQSWTNQLCVYVESSTGGDWAIIKTYNFTGNIVWVRVTYSSNTLTIYYSTNGIDFTSIHTQNNITVLTSTGDKFTVGSAWGDHKDGDAIIDMSDTYVKVGDDIVWGNKCDPKSVDYGAAYDELPTPTRTGYTFAGWFTDATNGTQVSTSTTMGAANTTVYAHWTPTTYNITYDLDDGSVAVANPSTYTVESASFTLNNPTKTGYTFAGWTGTGLNSATVNVTIAQGSTGDRSYTATWTAKTIQVSVSSGGWPAHNYITLTTPLNNVTKTIGDTLDFTYTKNIADVQDTINTGGLISRSSGLSTTDYSKFSSLTSYTITAQDVEDYSTINITVYPRMTLNFVAVTDFEVSTTGGTTNIGGDNVPVTLWMYTQYKLFNYTPNSGYIAYGIYNAMPSSADLTANKINTAVTASGGTYNYEYPTVNTKTLYVLFLSQHTVSFDVNHDGVNPNLLDFNNATIIKGKVAIPAGNLIAGQTYTFSTNTSVWAFKISGSHDGTPVVERNDVRIDSYTFTLESSTENKYIFIKVNKNGSTQWVTDISDLSSYNLKLEQGSTATAWTEYPKPITYGLPYGTLPTPTRTGYRFDGWYGKNLYNLGTMSDYSRLNGDADKFRIEGNSLIAKNGSGGGYVLQNNTLFDYVTGQTLTLSYTTSGSNARLYVSFFDENGTNITGTIQSSVTTNSAIYNQWYGDNGGAYYKGGTILTFSTTDASVKYFKVGFICREDGDVVSAPNTVDLEFTDIQLELGSTRTAYEPYVVYNRSGYITDGTTVATPYDHTLTAHWTRVASVTVKVKFAGSCVAGQSVVVKIVDTANGRSWSKVVAVNTSNIATFTLKFIGEGIYKISVSTPTKYNVHIDDGDDVVTDNDWNAVASSGTRTQVQELTTDDITFNVYVDKPTSGFVGYVQR